MQAGVPNPLDIALQQLPDAPLCVALSGGLDSTTLLHVLAQRCHAQSRPMRALHVHHGLSAQADAWARACEAMCAALDVPLVVRRVDVDTKSGFGVEAAAREARRTAFAEVLQAGEVLVLAQHCDDQAETFLLRALRGSGPDGLGSMRTWQPFAHGFLWRPWLDAPRSVIEAHARTCGLRWIEDDSNADERFDRNYLRRQVMPMLRARWPHAADALAQSAAHCRDAALLLHDEDMRALAAVRTLDPHVVRLTGLRPLPPARRARVLRVWLEELALPPMPRSGVHRIEADLLHARLDASPTFKWHGAVVHAWRDLLHAGRALPTLPPDFSATWTGRDLLELPNGGRLVLEADTGFDAPVQVRSRLGGERISLPGRTHSHALKHVLQEAGVPPWVRAQLPLIVDEGGAVLAAGDLIHSATFDAWLRVRGARLSWTPPRD